MKSTAGSVSSTTGRPARGLAADRGVRPTIFAGRPVMGKKARTLRKPCDIPYSSSISDEGRSLWSLRNLLGTLQGQLDLSVWLLLRFLDKHPDHYDAPTNGGNRESP